MSKHLNIQKYILFGLSYVSFKTHQKTTFTQIKIKKKKLKIQEKITENQNKLVKTNMLISTKS